MIKKILVLLFLLGFFFVLSRLFFPRIAAFGCFDDCFNYGAGYFITRGKTLYTDIFFNHQPLMPYISAVVQKSTTPINIYDLLLKHRKVLLIWGFFWSIFLVFRFGIPALFFTVYYELTKWYFFGDRFLAEGFIVYPLVYLLLKLLSKTHEVYDDFFLPVCVWFVFWSREPYVPLVLLLFIGNLLTIKNKKRVLCIFTVFSVLLFFLFPVSSYIHNVLTVNQKTVLSDSLKASPILQTLSTSVTYPFSIIFIQGSHPVWQLLQIVSIVILTCTLFLFIQKKNRIILFSILFILLPLANIRAVPVGTVYYRAFQLLPYLGLFLSLCGYAVNETRKIHKQLGLSFFLVLVVSLSGYLLSSAFFGKEKINSHEELISNYSTEIQIGNTIKELSLPTDTIFLDGWAELIFWQSDRLSPYTYSWYTSVMPLIPEYSIEREKMFRSTPPDFYFGSCPKEIIQNRMLAEHIRDLYVNIPVEKKPSCLWVTKTKLPHITDKQWSKAKELLFDRPL